MKINNKNVSIPVLEVEKIEGELVIYNNKKIISLNKTASFIWEAIIELSKKESNITTEQICCKVMEIFGIPYDENEKVQKDIDDIIKQFIKESIICVID